MCAEQGAGRCCFLVEPLREYLEASLVARVVGPDALALYIRHRLHAARNGRHGLGTLKSARRPHDVRRSLGVHGVRFGCWVAVVYML